MTEPLLPCVEIETGAAPSAAVIWMHGLGADGHDFAPIVPQLGLPQSLPVRFVFPHAPTLPVTLNGGYRMPAWYDILSLDRDAAQDEAGIRASQRAIEALIAREVARGVSADRIVLAGFSQGGVMALQTALRHPARLAGVLALSTYLALADTLAAEKSAANQDIPVFMAHGDFDAVIAPAFAAASRDRLAAAGYAVDWRTYPMAHAVCPEEIAGIGAFLRRVLA